MVQFLAMNLVCYTKKNFVVLEDIAQFWEHFVNFYMIEIGRKKLRTLYLKMTYILVTF